MKIKAKRSMKRVDAVIFMMVKRFLRVYVCCCSGLKVWETGVTGNSDRGY